MEGTVKFLDIIFFAMVAAFLVFRLRSVLGRRTGHERQRHDPRLSAGEAGGAGVPGGSAEPEVSQLERPIEDDLEIEVGEEVSAGLTQIRLADRDFHPGGFLGGARAAFEMVIAAYASNDRETLRGLLSDDVLADFLAAIEARVSAGQTMEHTLVAITSTDIVGAEVSGQIALVTVKIVSDQINMLRDAEGRVVEGAPDQVNEVTDVWTFSRDTRSQDPNWALAATQSPD